MIRGKNEGDLSADRLGLNVRSEVRLNERAYIFGQNQFLRDRFKSIDYLMAPAAGLGYTIIETPETTMPSILVSVACGKKMRTSVSRRPVP
jgi:putative salt-induced outer membrane protein YdiY